MIGRTNAGGGGGGLSPNSAVIHVTAPVGSTISFAKGGVVAKVLGPEKSHVNSADASLADWYYSVSQNNYGMWTVTAEKDGFNQSKSVTISTNKQHDVSIYLPIYLYNQGDQATSITGGWEVSSGVAASGYLKSTTNPVFATSKVSLSLTGGAADKSSAINTKNAVDLTNYSTLNIAVTQSISNGGAYWSACSNSTGYYVSDAAARADNYGDISKTTLDISSLTGLYYVFFSILSWTNTGGTADLTKVWLS